MRGETGGLPASPRAKVVHVITRLEWGGAQENTLTTVRLLDGGRFDRVLVAGEGGILDGRAAGIPGCRFLPVAPLVREIRPVSDLRAFLALRRIFREEKRAAPGVPLVVHTHSSKAGILGRAAARAAGADAILHSVHGFGFHDGQARPVRSLFVGLERVAARWTDRFVAVSEENVRTAERERIFPRSRARLIRSGFDTERFLPGPGREGRRLLGVPEAVPLVGTVAVFKPQKAPLDFVAVARRVAERVPGVRFAMVGDGEMREASERAAREASLSDRFHFPGWRKEIPELLRAFDLFLLTSRWEGLPKVVPQALIAGVPVVATAVDGTREIVDDGVDGFLCPPGDVEMLSARCVEVLSGRARLAPGAKRSRLLEEFDEKGMVRAQERLYGEILSEKGFPGWS